MVNFSQIPVTNEVKLKQNFDLLSTLLIGTSGWVSAVKKFPSDQFLTSPLIPDIALMSLSSIVYFYIALSNGPSCLHKLDAPRKTMMQQTEK